MEQRNAKKEQTNWKLQKKIEKYLSRLCKIGMVENLITVSNTNALPILTNKIIFLSELLVADQEFV
jgi:hypothetical protein